MISRLFGLLVIIISIYVLREGYFYLLIYKNLPTGTTIGQVDVTGLTLIEAGEKVAQAYGTPISLTSKEMGETVEIEPGRLDFVLDLQTMLQQAETAQKATPWWIGFSGYLLKTSLKPINIPLIATHSEAKVTEITTIASDMIATPPLEPRINPDDLTFLPGEAGYLPVITATVQTMTEAMYRPTDRTALLVLTYAQPPAITLTLLKQLLQDQLGSHPDLLGSLYIKDLRTGEEIGINEDIALSGTSIVKVPIVLETFRRYIEGTPDFDTQKLINETLIDSGNYSANLLLDKVAGEDNAYLGVDILTESMNRLGLINTFIVTPYEEKDRPGIATKSTPANNIPDLKTDPDPTMQTTASEIGSLLAMIYQCAHDSGALLALYPDTLSKGECQALLDVMKLNVKGNIIRCGVPETVQVSHKHGWATNTHGDVGIVYSPMGDYVIVTYLTQPDQAWLVADYSFPILHDLSRIVYNFFNQEAPYGGGRCITFAEESANGAVTTTLTTTVGITPTTTIITTTAP